MCLLAVILKPLASLSKALEGEGADIVSSMLNVSAVAQHLKLIEQSDFHDVQLKTTVILDEAKGSIYLEEDMSTHSVKSRLSWKKVY